MDLRNVLKVNQRVYIEILDNKGEVQRYSSRVENMSEDRVVLASPIKHRTPVFVPSGNYVTVIFTDNLCVYSFRSKVIANYNQRIPFMVVKTPDKLEKIQQREYVRVPINLNVLLSYTDEDDQTREIWCKSRDLSGGGLMLVNSKPFKLSKGDEVNLTFHLEGETISVKGEIMRVYHELDISGIERHILGVKFKELSEKDRQKIIKFVYQRQIELRRKGLL